MADAPAPKRFYRTTQSNQAIAGVCGGVAKYLNLDPTLVRILWVVGTLISLGIGILAYLVFWVAAPDESAAAK